jgi:hypothetical protein
MQSSLSVDARLEAQFSSWDIAPAPEIPDLLMTLRAHGTTITLFKDQVQQAFTAQVTQLEAKSIRLTLQDNSTEGDPFQLGGKVLWVGFRHSERITADKRDPEDIIDPINGFSLLGFAFLFKGPEQALSLEKFLEGTLETR